MSTTGSSVSGKKLIIIGAGISGLAAGVYALKAGYDTEIYEMNSVPGGECTGWDRQGYHIDGCIHWLTGTRSGDPLNKVWRDVGALSDDVKIYNPESFAVMETPSGKIHLYKDMDRLKAHLAEIAPEDKDALDEFYAAIAIFEKTAIPMMPVELMNPIEIFGLIRNSGKQTKKMKELSIPLGTYLERFKNKDVRKILQSYLPSEESAYILPCTLATVMTGNGGRPEGGSRGMALRMADKFKSLGGKLFLDATVDEIVVADGRAVGIRLVRASGAAGGKSAGAPGDETNSAANSGADPTADSAGNSTSYSSHPLIPADHVLSATDVHVTLDRFLHGKYPQATFSMRDADPRTNPGMTGCQASFGLDIDLSAMDPDLLIEVDPIRFEDHELRDISIKHYCYEPAFAPAGHSVLCVVTDGNYDWWKALASDETTPPDSRHIRSEKYLAEKNRVLEDMKSSLLKKYPQWEGHLKPLDFVTPLTYERYCGAFRGQWMSYGPTEHSKSYMHNGKIKEIRNFSMCGQWLMGPGGTPVAVITGKWAIQRLCKKDKRPWRF